MKFHPTPQQAASLYDCLREFLPFRAWKLPPADEVEFRITRHADRFGHWSRYTRTDQHIIAVSARTVTSFALLVLTIAHEMIHLRQDIAKTASRSVEHNREFKRIAQQICLRMDWEVDALL